MPKKQRNAARTLCKSNFFVKLNSWCCLTLCLGLSACTSDPSAYRVPGTDFDRDSVFFIVRNPEDERGLAILIQEEMRGNSFIVSVGKEDERPADAGLVVRYGAQWHWDITWYLLEFQITVHQPEGDLLVASAHSYRTSLARKTPPNVVRDTIGQLLGEIDEQ